MLDEPDERTIDWATAEELALRHRSSPTASPIRLTGEDVERGTFSHRHAVFHDADDRQHASCRCRRCRRRARRSRSTTARSPRTRRVGFEFGYNVQEPARLVIWEAQYGDFINGAQVILDEFVDVGARQVGADAVARAAAAARLRRPGAGSLERAARALPAARRRHQPARRQLHDGGAVLPPAAAPGRAAATPIRCRWSC